MYSRIDLLFSLRLIILDYPRVSQTKSSGNNDDHDDDDHDDIKEFTISNPGDCTSEKRYGFDAGKPCVLVKMNKVIKHFQDHPKLTYDFTF